MYHCPKCQSDDYVKAGSAGERQRYKCKSCNYHFTVSKLGKKIDDYYITKALQLYLEGVSYREIERILGISHVSVLNWVKAYKITRPSKTSYKPTYAVLTQDELLKFMSDKSKLKGAGMMVTEVGDKFMLIRWERFKT
jgi:transposase-like protein